MYVLLMEVIYYTELICRNDFSDVCVVDGGHLLHRVNKWDVGMTFSDVCVVDGGHLLHGVNKWDVGVTFSDVCVVDGGHLLHGVNM